LPFPLDRPTGLLAALSCGNILHSAMGNLLPLRFSFWELTAGTTAGLTIRYLLLAGIAWVLAYVIFRQRWIHRKIISRFPSGREVRRELAYSVVSVVVFGWSARPPSWRRAMAGRACIGASKITAGPGSA
jgi:hypothetical protein